MGGSSVAMLRKQNSQVETAVMSLYVLRFVKGNDQDTREDISDKHDRRNRDKRICRHKRTPYHCRKGKRSVNLVRKYLADITLIVFLF